MSISLLAFGVGALHALDADHIMAVSSLASRRIAPARCVRLGARWAIGHGGALLVFGMVCYALGHALPIAWHVHAERMVAVLLFVVGASVLTSLVGGGASLRVHHHPGIRAHVHWVRAGGEHGGNAADDHGAVIIGALHGLAGSAPLLAIIPAGQHRSLAEGAMVFTAFSLGVLLTMLLFGLMLGAVFACSDRAIPWIRGVAGCGSLVLGSALFAGSF